MGIWAPVVRPRSGPARAQMTDASPHGSCHGSITDTPETSKCRTLRVITHRPCRNAVAAMRPSGVGRIEPAHWHLAVISPQMLAVARSIASIRSPNRSPRPLSHFSRSSFFCPSANSDMAFVISPIVITLTNRSRSWTSLTAALTFGLHCGLRTSASTQVSSRIFKATPLALRPGLATNRGR